LTAGAKVTLSQAALLQMLGLRPFSYGLKVTTVFDNGAVYPSSVLDMTDDDILKKFFKGVNNVAALSLQIGHPTVVSVPHSVINGFKNLVAISLETSYDFPAAEKIKKLLSDPTALAAAQAALAPTSTTTTSAPSGGGPAEKPKEEKKKEEKEEEEDADMGGLFGGGGDEDEDY